MHLSDLLEASIGFLQAQIAEVDQRMERIVQAEDTLRHSCKLLIRSKGIGTLTACSVCSRQRQTRPSSHLPDSSPPLLWFPGAISSRCGNLG